MTYTVVMNKRFSNLCDNVRDYIKRGWVPQGGVSWDGHHYIQAMILS